MWLRLWAARRGEPVNGHNALAQAADTCLLSRRILQQRLTRIQRLADQHLLGQEQDGLSLRLRYATAAEAELTDLVSAERDCCGFLDFRLRPGPHDVELTITAADDQDTFTQTLFDHFRGAAPMKSGCGAASCGCA